MKRSINSFVLSFLLIFTTSFLSGQSCTETDILQTIPGVSFHHFGSSVDMGTEQFVVGAPGQESCYYYHKDGSDWSETILKRTGPAIAEEFGFDVAVDGDRIVVGAPFNNEMGPDVGSIYIYDWDGSNWNETQIFASDAYHENLFGYSVDVVGDRIVVGAPSLFFALSKAYIFDLVGGVWEETILNPATNITKFGHSVAIKTDTVLVGSPQTNSAHMYKYDGSEWEEEIFHGSDVVPGDNFGKAVAIGDGKIVVGADLDDGINGINYGSIYVFEKESGTYNETKIVASDGTVSDYLGRNLSLSGDSIIAGVVKPNNYSGKAYLFVKENGAWIESQVVASDGGPSDQYGHSVSILNGDFIVGARYDSAAANQTGSVYLNEWNNGSLVETKINPSDAVPADRFGYAVDVAQEFMVVGAERDYGSAPQGGAAHVYQKNGSSWTFNTKLLASDGNESDGFGYDVAVHGNRIVVGAPDDSDHMDRAGSAYIYDWNGTIWNETKITASDESTLANFGYAVEIREDRLIVGNKKDAVYVFELIEGVWTEVEILSDANATDDDRFGYHLDIGDDRILIGAHYNDEDETNAGAVYVFDYDGTVWNETILYGSNPVYFGAFGRDVALDNNRLIVGALGHYPGGLVYIFDYDGSSWNETQTVVGNDTSNGDAFGKGIGLSGNRFVVGAPGNDDDGGQSGSAYIFDLVNGNWVSSKITASDASAANFFGTSVSMFGESLVIGTDALFGKAYIYDCPCIDNFLPEAVCQDITVALDNSASVTIQAEEIDNGSTDDCILESFSLNQSTFGCSDIGSQQVTLTITDIAGNQASCMANVEITDPLTACIPCTNALLTIENADIITDNILFNDTDAIQSDAQVTNDNIHFKAKNLIDLEINFEVLVGKTFTAEIGPCP